MPAPEIAQECRAQNRTKKRIFLYGFGYGSLDTKKGPRIWPYLFGYGHIFLDMAVGGFFDLVSNFSGWWFFGFSQ